MSDDDTYDHYRVDPNADPLAHPAERPNDSFAAMQEGWYVGGDGTVFPVYARHDPMYGDYRYETYHAAKGPNYTGYISSSKLGETFFLDLTAALDRGLALTERRVSDDIYELACAQERANGITAQLRVKHLRELAYRARLAQIAPSLRLGAEVHVDGE